MTTTTIPEDFTINTPHVDSGVIEGIPWVAARAPLFGALNGYVRLPDGHPWLEVKDGWEIENSIPWGEITYMSGNWIGFDSMHSGQYWPSEERFNRRHEGDTLMADEMVIGWTKQLAQEAHDYTANGTYSI